ncbi:hypothetical protein EBZ80_19130 [bacterium]|nr:hypothetical protein [bacterium]
MNPESQRSVERMRFALGVTLSHLRELFTVYPETKPFLEGVVFCIEDALSKADGTTNDTE